MKQKILSSIFLVLLTIVVVLIAVWPSPVVDPVQPTAILPDISPTPAKKHGAVIILSTPAFAPTKSRESIFYPEIAPSPDFYGQNAFSPSVVGEKVNVVKLWSDLNDFNVFLGNKEIANDFLNNFVENSRKAELEGFFTWYYLPEQMNAYRTIYKKENCFTAIDATLYGRDKRAAMHFVLVNVKKPEPMPPFIAFVGDLGPLEQFHLSFTTDGKKTVQVKYGGQPVVMDFPIGCFLNYVNKDLKTSFGEVYILDPNETLDYINKVMSQ